MICLHVFLDHPYNFIAPFPHEDSLFFHVAPPSSVVASGLASLDDARLSMQPGRRLFLAIFTSPNADGRLRNVIRKTYLSSTESNKKGPFPGGTLLPSVCSLPDFAKNLSLNTTTTQNDCQVIYSFVSEGKPRDRFTGEIDLIYLNLSSTGKETFNRVHCLFRYMLSSNWTESNVPFPFDFVAYTHTRVLIYPTRLWPFEMFWSEHGPTVYNHTMLYSGAVTNTTTNSKVEHPPMFQDYVLLSRNLLKSVLRPPFHRRVKDWRTESAMEGIIHASADTMRVEPAEDMTVIPTNATAVVPLRDGVFIVDGGQYNYMTFLKMWDDYKDAELATYEDPIEEARVRSNVRISGTIGSCRHGPRMLLGIFTMKDDAQEMERRQAIRETYLNYYRSKENGTLACNRICSLQELISLDSPNHSALLRECQLAYTFVSGDNPQGPTELVDFNESMPLTLPSTGNENDIVSLNIRENMKEGKSQTFFKFATTVVDEYVYFDYIGKTDTDTLVFPEELLDQHINNLPLFPNNVRVYGGSPRGKIQIDHIKGPAYNIGAFYWMSVDLARYITSPDCDRQKLKVFSEDKSVGNFVHSHKKPIRRVKLKMLRCRAFEHPIKNVDEFRSRWAEQIAKS